ncbi:DMT family transporter [Kocuria sp. BT304]|uniref:EamA family transporter n=1 Tax=Kocuria sp. BT304 TaxID=1702043 RepID=UPI000DD4E139|nr:EamA family transporter [Kocuria sp. BT304]
MSGPPDSSAGGDGTTTQGVVLVLAAALVTQTGAAVAVSLFDEVGALGAVFLRLTLAAVVLSVVVRPRWSALTRADLPVVLGFGTALGAMNMLIYQAIARLPLGVAVTIELLGPLVLSVVLSRRVSGALWAALAFAGVLLLSGVGPGTGAPDLSGVLFALAAAGMWVLYILMSRQAGRSFAGVQGLAMAMVVGAVLAAPFGIVSGGAALLQPWVLLVGLAVAVMSSALPYALELAALRRLAAETFSILVSTAPAVAALVGWLLLGQALGPLELWGMGLVILASVAAVRSGPRPGRRTPEDLLPPAP